MQVECREIIENNDSKSINRISTKDDWALVNPVLQLGEIGFEKDGQMTNTKLGDGVTAWNDLPYIWKQCPYEVGDILQTENATLPSERWPGTTWEALPGGHCLVAAGTNPNTGTVFAVGDTGGEEAHQLTIGELAKHTHQYFRSKIVGSEAVGPDDRSIYGTDEIIYNMKTEPYTYPEGNSQPHNNLPPYISVYLFKRVE